MVRKEDIIISVVIPVYNNERIVEKSIISVLEQKVNCAYELVIIDDGSTDDSVKVIENVIHGFTNSQLIRQNNAGASAARNRGVKESKGKWIVFLDSDDVMLPGALNARLKAIHDMPTCTIFTGRQITKSTDGRKYELLESTSWKSLYHSGSNVEIDNFMSQLISSTVLIHTNTVTLLREEFLAVNGFDETLSRGEDHHLWLRLAVRTNKLGFINHVLSIYIHREGSLSQVQERDSVHIIKFVEKLLSESRFEPYKKELRTKLFDAYRNTIWHYRQHQQKEKALECTTQGVIAFPLSINMWKWLIAARLGK